MAESDLQVPFLKRVLLKPLLVPGVTRALSVVTDTQATIFMLHRFPVPEMGVNGHDLAALRRNLAYLRKERYDLISLEEMFSRLRAGVSCKRAIAFTIDDGYFDHAQIGGPVFAEFDCPVTTFVTTGFLDGKIWFWWDKLTTIFEGTGRKELRARIGNKEKVYRLKDSKTRTVACLDLQLLCQDASEADRLACVGELGREGEVELPASPPPRFAPLSWDDARRLENMGMTFGPHTVTHPVLSSAPDAQAEFEITESWRRLSAEVSRPVPVFCYPAGRTGDFGEREISVIRRLGLWGAVVGRPGQIGPVDFRKSEAAPFRVPRFGYLDSLPHLMQCVSGLEVLKARFRGAFA
jgi:peptidoglycan/xylan/chitin deacetylase (PgdA/CDA1 family)